MDTSLIILGKDPDNYGGRNTRPRWLLKCPDCSKIRSVGYETMRTAPQRGNTRCRSCTNQRRRIFIKDTKDIIVLKQLIGYSPSGTPRALVQCPVCDKQRTVQRGFVQRTQSTLCRSCMASHTLMTFIENNGGIVVIKQLAARDTFGKGQALVQCPDCGERRLMRRSHIFASQRTRCRSCSVSGKRHRAWKGGTHAPYPHNWHKLSQHIRERDSHICQYSNCKATSQSLGRLLDVHHIIPLRESFDNSEYNLVTLCPLHHTWADAHLDKSISIFSAIIEELYDIPLQ